MKPIDQQPASAGQADRDRLRRDNADLQERVRALHSLVEVSILINSTYAVEDLLLLVMEKAQSVMNAEAGSVMIFNEEKGVLECPVALGEVGDKIRMIELPVNKGIAGWVFTNGKALNIADAYRDSRFNPQVDRETGFTTRSILAAPLMVHTRVIGVAEVINRSDGRAFDNTDLEIFSTFCRQVAMAVENARIHQLELERQRIAHQLEAARVIQQSFLPDELPVSANRRFQLAARSLAATAVGGDYYDVIEFDSRHAGITIGDVSGKGVPAALYMARMVSDFRTRVHSERRPEQVMSALNNTLVSRTNQGMFITAIYGVLDSGSGRFTFSNAGHLPVIHISAQTGRAELLSDAAGIPLGISAEYPYPETTVRLERGDCLVLITDGVIEAKDRTGAEYSLSAIRRFLCKPFADAHSIVEDILAEIRRFSEGVTQFDDLTVVAVRFSA